MGNSAQVLLKTFQTKIDERLKELYDYFYQNINNPRKTVTRSNSIFNFDSMRQAAYRFAKFQADRDLNLSDVYQTGRSYVNAGLKEVGNAFTFEIAFNLYVESLQQDTVKELVLFGEEYSRLELINQLKLNCGLKKIKDESITEYFTLLYLRGCFVGKNPEFKNVIAIAKRFGFNEQEITELLIALVRVYSLKGSAVEEPYYFDSKKRYIAAKRLFTTTFSKIGDINSPTDDFYYLLAYLRELDISAPYIHQIITLIYQKNLEAYAGLSFEQLINKINYYLVGSLLKHEIVAREKLSSAAIEKMLETQTINADEITQSQALAACKKATEVFNLSLEKRKTKEYAEGVIADDVFEQWLKRHYFGGGELENTNLGVVYELATWYALEEPSIEQEDIVRFMIAYVAHHKEAYAGDKAVEHFNPDGTISPFETELDIILAMAIFSAEINAPEFLSAIKAKMHLAPQVKVEEQFAEKVSLTPEQRRSRAFIFRYYDNETEEFLSEIPNWLDFEAHLKIMGMEPIEIIKLKNKYDKFSANKYVANYYLNERFIAVLDDKEAFIETLKVLGVAAQTIEVIMRQHNEYVKALENASFTKYVNDETRENYLLAKTLLEQLFKPDSEHDKTDFQVYLEKMSRLEALKKLIDNLDTALALVGEAPELETELNELLEELNESIKYFKVEEQLMPYNVIFLSANDFTYSYIGRDLENLAKDITVKTADIPKIIERLQFNGPIVEEVVPPFPEYHYRRENTICGYFISLGKGNVLVVGFSKYISGAGYQKMNSLMANPATCKAIEKIRALFASGDNKTIADYIVAHNERVASAVTGALATGPNKKKRRVSSEQV